MLILAARTLAEAVTFALAAAFLHATTLGRSPLPLWPTALALLGVGLVLTAVLRERGTVERSSLLTVAVVAGAAGWGLTLEARSPDALAVLTRAIGFGIAGLAYLWRALDVARGLQRWREVRNGALLALAAVVVASLLPGPIDRSALPVLGLAVALGGAVGLSLARSTEELALATGPVRGRPAGSSATGAAFALGLLAFGAALGLPLAQDLLTAAGRTVGPVIGEALFVVLLPLGYLAAYLVYFALWLRELLRPTGVEVRLPQPPFAVADDEERLREIESVRPFVFGALELIVALVALGFAVALVARLVQERRALLPEGVTLEREAVEGIGLGMTVRTLLAKRAARRRPPVDDGTPGAALARLYWRLLEAGERAGAGWRAPAETPAEHGERLARGAERWHEAAPLVRAFEALRYGERDPDERTLAAAREALRVVEGGR